MRNNPSTEKVLDIISAKCDLWAYFARMFGDVLSSYALELQELCPELTDEECANTVMANFLVSWIAMRRNKKAKGKSS